MPAKIYDWDGWFERRTFRLTADLDYDCGTVSMAQQVRNAATARGLRVRVVERPDGLTITVIRGAARCSS